jgi:hypothetical protein
MPQCLMGDLTLSGLPDWNKVYAGLLRLYQGEVLGKLPVMQHVVFGSILQQSWTSEAEDVRLAGTNDLLQTVAPWARPGMHPASATQSVLSTGEGDHARPGSVPMSSSAAASNPNFARIRSSSNDHSNNPCG